MRRFMSGKYSWAAVWLLAAAARAAAGDAGCPHCEEQFVQKDVVRHECQLVPEKKPIKKTVYEVKEVPFCLHKLPPLLGHHRQYCDACRECGCVRYKKVLVKKEVVVGEICTTRCVPVEFPAWPIRSHKEESH